MKFFKPFLFFAVLGFFCALMFSTHGNAAQTKDATNTLDAYAPFEELIQITASDVTVYDPPLRGCIIETDGDVVLSTIKGDSNVTISVLKGQIVPALIDQVRAATTSALTCGR